VKKKIWRAFMAVADFVGGTLIFFAFAAVFMFLVLSFVMGIGRLTGGW
jgi:hypothetical protein